MHLKLQPRVLVGLNPLEYLVTRNRHNALVSPIAYHRVALASACLAVRKQTTMIPKPSVVKDLLSEGLVHHFLVCVVAVGAIWFFISVCSRPALVMGPEAVIERERPWFASLRVSNGGCGPFHFDATLCIQVLFSFVEWAHPHRYFNTTTHLI